MKNSLYIITDPVSTYYKRVHIEGGKCLADFPSFRQPSSKPIAVTDSPQHIKLYVQPYRAWPYDASALTYDAKAKQKKPEASKKTGVNWNDSRAFVSVLVRRTTVKVLCYIVRITASYNVLVVVLYAHRGLMEILYDW